MQVGSVIRRRVTNRGGTREERGRLKTQDYTRLRDIPLVTINFGEGGRERKIWNT